MAKVKITQSLSYLPEEIRRRRGALGISQRRLAQEASIAKCTVQRVEYHQPWRSTVMELLLGALNRLEEASRGRTQNRDSRPA